MDELERDLQAQLARIQAQLDALDAGQDPYTIGACPPRAVQTPGLTQYVFGCSGEEEDERSRGVRLNLSAAVQRCVPQDVLASKDDKRMCGGGCDVLRVCASVRPSLVHPCVCVCVCVCVVRVSVSCVCVMRGAVTYECARERSLASDAQRRDCLRHAQVVPRSHAPEGG